jgi:hypothetical protein
LNNDFLLKGFIFEQVVSVLNTIHQGSRHFSIFKTLIKLIPQIKQNWQQPFDISINISLNAARNLTDDSPPRPLTAA